jgi:hypothetical protein
MDTQDEITALNTFLTGDEAIGWTRLDVLLLPPLLCPVNKQQIGQLIPSNQNRQAKLNAEQEAGLDEAGIYIIVRLTKGN